MMTSLCIPVEVIIPSGITAYILTGREITNGNHKHAVDNEYYEPGAIVFNVQPIDLGFIPAGMPILLKGEEGTHSFVIKYNATDSEKTDKELHRIEELKKLNKLEGSFDARLFSARPNTSHHILSKKNGKVGMYRVGMVPPSDRNLDYVTTSTFLNPAHKSWLPYTNTTLVSGYSLAVGGSGDEATEITVPSIEEFKEDIIYDLQGRRVHYPLLPGLYLINNRKTLVK